MEERFYLRLKKEGRLTSSDPEEKRALTTGQGKPSIWQYRGLSSRGGKKV